MLLQVALSDWDFSNWFSKLNLKFSVFPLGFEAPLYLVHGVSSCSLYSKELKGILESNLYSSRFSVIIWNHVMQGGEDVGSVWCRIQFRI